MQAVDDRGQPEPVIRDVPMTRRQGLLCVWMACLPMVALACAGSLSSKSPVAPPQGPAPAAFETTPPQVAVPTDPIQDLIAASQAHFELGKAELEMGHLVKAKAEFNAAMDVLLESPYGARSNARLQEHFDRLVDRISAFELRALAEGDGFAEKPTVPASLDELLALSTIDLPAAKPGLAEAVATDLKTTAHDVPIPLNPRVLSYIDLFQGRLRDWFQTSLQRGSAYLPMIQGVLRAEGLPLDLAYVPIVESAFNTNALSRAKAKGFWQLMSGTAIEQGLTHDWYIDERSNPEKATAAAARYLKLLNRMFRGDWMLTLASYNGGPGSVQKAVRQKGVADFWALAERGRYLPRETREYVPMVLAAMVVARNPTQYGFFVETAAPPVSDSVTLTGPVDLRRVAEWTAVSVEEIQRLNPELRRWTTPLRGESYRLRVPAGTTSLVEQRLSEATADQLAALQWYTVRRGESLTTIANSLRVRRNDLAEANYLSVRARVNPGQKLLIPRAPTTLLSARTNRAEPIVEHARSINVALTPAPTAPEPSGSVKLIYRVKRGDTLYAIAQAFRTTVSAIRSWNGLKGDRITPGDRLTVFTNRQNAARFIP